MMEFICPDSLNGVCTETRCGRCLVNPREDGVDDNLQPTYTASCTFDGTLQYFHGLKPTRDDKQKAAEAEAAKREQEINAKSATVDTKEREVAFSSVTGLIARNSIHVKNAKQIKVYVPNAAESFEFTAAGEWKIINRFLDSLARDEDNSYPNYPVPFNTKEKNACKGRCLALIEKFIEQQPARRKIRNTKFEPFARFRVELLRGWAVEKK